MVNLGETQVNVNIDAAAVKRAFEEWGISSESVKAFIREEVARQLKDVKHLTVDELAKEMRIRTGVRA
jgi:hypothetical protein